SMEDIFQDVDNIILPGMTHWQSRNFFAYFPSNASYASLLGEMMATAMGAQCMIWETSPAATELEERVMNWLGEICGIPASWEGVIQPTASDATLAAILSARERASEYQINETGLDGQHRFRVYASSQTHSSIEKGVKIAGLGRQHLVAVEVDAAFAMKPEALRAAIEADKAQGYHPLCVIATLGTTSSTAIDPLQPIAEVCQEFGIWLHVDAAYGGNALVLPEFHWMLAGIELADSLVMNPHKWLFTHFDCSAYFVKDTAALVRTFEIQPEYLKTAADQRVNNYRDWGIPLGRRFRALKLWFVLRHFGVDGLREKIQFHNQQAQAFGQWVQDHPDFEVMAPISMNLVCFRFAKSGVPDLDAFNAELVARLNGSGKMYLTHTKLHGTYVLRFVPGATRLQASDVQAAWQLILDTADELAGA
ncbi:MAG: aminotransferase class I/II-fold pyridoxal phosphate-dependent enzyme, partial [Bacteroidota bacterium]